ncbi:hypothetical protein GGS26DRAFT_578015 [Hypomontagnella submonticulosa]|nr:hypothetical protein GGS26DRAFT_578015 [Hypomontagnella submonticulosa]
MSEAHDEWVDLSRLSPAPLKLPSSKPQNPTMMAGTITPTETTSEYLFPLPPKRQVDSRAQSIRPRSPLPPPYSLLAVSSTPPKETNPKTDTSGVITTPFRVIRRSQSATEVRNVAQWKPLPARPLALNNKEHEGAVKGKQDFHKPAQTDGAKESKVPVASANGDKALRSTTVPHKGVLLSTSAAKGKEQTKRGVVEGDSRVTEQQRIMDGGNRGRYTRLDETPKPEKLYGDNGRFTLEEILWLHQNYRGEATFLKAWGFHITREGEREQGLEILRALMSAEPSRGLKQHQHRKRQEAEENPCTRAQLSILPRDKEGLHAIEEEMASCGFRPMQ